MKLYAILKNERGGKKSTGDDTRLQIELSYGNKLIGTIGLYAIRDGGEDLGYRVLYNNKVIDEVERKKGKKQNGECEEGGNHFTTRQGNEEICRKCLKTI